MICDQCWHLIRQGAPKELENVRLMGSRWKEFCMSPNCLRLPLIAEMVKISMVDLFTPKIRHITLLLPKKPIENKVSQARFFKRFA